MAKQRLTRKAIKQPDQFITFSARALAWSKDHTTYLLYSLLGVVVLIGLIIGWVSWQQQRDQHASVLLYEALKTLDQDDAHAAASEATIKALQTISQDYGHAPAAAQAAWHLGHIYFQKGEYQAALTAYEQAQQRLANDLQHLEPILVTLDMAYAQEASGAYAQAINSFDRVLQSTATWLHGEAYLGMGRCQEQNGATAQAIAVYERAVADVKVDETSQQLAEERLLALRPEPESATASTTQPATP